MKKVRVDRYKVLTAAESIYDEYKKICDDTDKLKGNPCVAPDEEAHADRRIRNKARIIGLVAENCAEETMELSWKDVQFLFE